jgi:hypothetical protein
VRDGLVDGRIVENSFNVGLGIASGIIFMAWCADVQPVASGEISIYTVECAQHTSCKLDEYLVSSSTFRADKYTNTVTYWHGGNLPETYRNCAVRDKKNWQCADGASMLDGSFSPFGWETRTEGVWTIRFWAISGAQWVLKHMVNSNVKQ